jgi:TatD DNase family protein
VRLGGWFDSHCHVQEAYLGADAPEASEEPAADVHTVLRAAADSGVDRLVCIGTGAVTSRQAVDLARVLRAEGSAPQAWASVGLHPHDASDGLDEVASLLAAECRAEESFVVAVGECGLDYHYEHSPRPLQRDAFAAQIALAHTYDLALVIHARDAWADLFDVLAAEGVPTRTVLHCFTGGPDELEQCLRAGLYVSFSGIVTFKNAEDVRAAAARCPAERMLVETDAPFLAPVPHRGRANQPAYLPLVGAAIAAVTGRAVEEVRDRTAATAATVFSTSR